MTALRRVGDRFGYSIDRIVSSTHNKAMSHQMSMKQSASCHARPEFEEPGVATGRKRPGAQAELARSVKADQARFPHASTTEAKEVFRSSSLLSRSIVFGGDTMQGNPFRRRHRRRLVMYLNYSPPHHHITLQYSQ